MPYIQADFAAMFQSTGVCDTKKTFGVDFDASVGVELSIQAATVGNEANPFWKQELFVSCLVLLKATQLMYSSHTHGHCSHNACLLVTITRSRVRSWIRYQRRASPRTRSVIRQRPVSRQYRP
jgi:hypothetical protein